MLINFQVPAKSWSPNTVRTRLVLNYKRIPYTQTYISYPDIKPLLHSLSVPRLPSKRLPYTLPAIKHPASLPNAPNGTINDSWPIALHLEAAFTAPQHPTIFPSGEASIALAIAVQKILSQVIVKGMNLVLPKIPAILDERGREYFERTRAEWFGCEVCDLAPKGDEETKKAWEVLEGELLTLTEMLRGASGRKKTGPFFEGEKPGYADFLVVAFLAWYERADRGYWERLMKVGKGELRPLWDACKPWLDGQGEEKAWDVPKI